MDGLIGKKYNYADYIKSPGELGTSRSGNIFKSMHDVNAILPYVDTLLYGKNVISQSSPTFGPDWDLFPLGSNYFIKSGFCGKNSSEECKGKDRYIYVRNVASGRIPCMGKFNPQTNMRGLIPGLLEDAADINPYALFKNLEGKGSQVNEKCIKQTLPVGPTSRNSPEGIRRETRCSVPLGPTLCMPEFFTDYKKKEYKFKYIFLFLIFILLLFFIINNIHK